MKKFLLMCFLIVVVAFLSRCEIFTEKKTDVITECEVTDMKPIFDVKFNGLDR